MFHQLIQSRFTKALLVTIIVAQTVACGGGGGSGGSNSSSGNNVSDSVVVPTGSVTLGWTAPATRADGTPLSLADIDGFRIYYGESAGDYTDSVEVADGTAQTVTVNDIPVGTYHVAITAFDANGSESGFSSEIPMTVQ
jgi:hypothetical protein